MSENVQPLIRMESVSKVFYTDEVETHALSEIYLEINQGEFVTIAGPSGCGKSTLLSLMGLLDTPTEGEYRLKERSVSELSTYQRSKVRNREIGFVFQAFNLIGDLTVYENVELPLTYRGMPGARPKGAGRGSVGASRNGASSPALSSPAFRRSAAARCSGTGPGRASLDPSCR